MTAIAQKSFSRGEVSPAVNARSDLAWWQSSLDLCQNFIVLKEGGARARGGTRFVAEVHDSAKKSRLIPFEASTQAAYVIELADQKVRFFRDAGVVLSGGAPYVVNSPWTSAQAAGVWYTQSNDVLFATHPEVRPKELRRYANANWQFADYDARKGPFVDENADEAKTIKVSAVTGSGITLTAAGFAFTAADVGKLVRLAPKDLADLPQWVGGSYANGDAKCFVYGNAYQRANVPDGILVGTSPPTHTEGSQPSGSGTGSGPDGYIHAYVTWTYLHSGFGIVKITSVAPGGATATADVVSRLPDQLVTTPSHKWALSPWSDADGWPSLVDFHEGRLVCANSAKFPSTLWFSKTDDFNNHAPGEKAADAMVLRLASRQRNAIRWLASGKVLGAGTSGREWTISPSNLNEALSPTNRKGAESSSEGSAQVRPVLTDNATLFVSASRHRLHEFSYSYDDNNFVAPELSILSGHIAKKGISDLAWDRDPNRIVWMALDDGTLAGMTYRRDQQIAAWHRHPMTNGHVESIAVIPTPDGTASQLWLIVRRQINGVTRRYIEVMQPAFDGADETDARHAWQLDCALRYEGPPATVISGLDHLEGETVSIVADGTVQPPQVVAGGKVTLARPATNVLVGLPFVARGRTLGLDPETAAGSVKGKKKRLNGLAVSLLDTVGGKIGTPGDLELLAPSGGGTMNAAPKLFSGTKVVTPIGGWDEEIQVEFVQDQPLPMTVRAIVPEFEVED